MTMAALARSIDSRASPQINTPAVASSSAAELGAQWRNPSDIFTVLLIIGGNVVQAAVAQLSGGRLTPVSFSFGWVGYAASALLSAVGNNKLMPPPDYPGFVINANTGYVRANSSWALGRILRDFEHWMDDDIKQKETEKLAFLANNLEAENSQRRYPVGLRISLRLSIYEASLADQAGRPKHDWVWWSGIAVALIQLSVSIVPFILYREWVTFLVTGAGTLLALVSGAIPQWKEEKWNCRVGTQKSVILTEGNGSKDSIVVLGNGCGLDLEDMAALSTVAVPSTRLWTILLAVAWIILLICVAGSAHHTWYLLGVGSIGMVHNTVVAGVARNPSSFGIHLSYKEVILGSKVMDVLAAAEEKYPRVGNSLLSTYFPGKLREREVQWWAYADRRAMAYDEDRRNDLRAVPHALPALRSDVPIPVTGFVDAT